MSDYTELVKALRYCGNIEKTCSKCKYFNDNCFEDLSIEAADAIEELQASVEREKAFADCWEEMAQECKARFEKLQKQLQKSESDNVNLTGWIAEEHANNCPHYIRNVHDRGDDSLCDKYKCEVTALPRWIPVTEQLPLYEVLGDMYLCYHVSGKHGQFSWVQIDWWDGEKFCFKKFGKNDHITHWMPLPEPPEEETE